MLAAAAGFRIAVPRPDRGVDLHIIGDSETDDDIPLARVQVKSWSVPQEGDRPWHYRGLNEKQFNVLAGTPSVPAFLFLVLVPKDHREYAHVDPRRLQLHYAAYWVSLKGRPKLADPSPTRSVAVNVSQENLLTVESLTALCEGRLTGQDGAQVPLARTP